MGAAKAYEGLLASGSAGIDDYIALALVYWAIADGGIGRSKGIPLDARSRAETRLLEVLAEAIQRDPSNCEAKFWSMYCTFIMYFQPERKEIEDLLDSGGHQCEGAFATMWRISSGDTAEIQAAQAILAEPDLSKNSKGRYLASIIDASLRSLKQA